MNVIGLSGRAQAGKDTVGMHLVKTRGFERVSFADPLRSMAIDINPMVGWDERKQAPEYLQEVVGKVGWATAKELWPEVRRFLQRLGTNGVRDHLGSHVWVNLADENIHELADHGVPGVVLTDVRFPNEVELIRRWSGTWAVIDRPGDNPAGTHASETSLDYAKADLTITNHGSIEQLFAEVDAKL